MKNLGKVVSLLFVSAILIAPLTSFAEKSEEEDFIKVEEIRRGLPAELNLSEKVEKEIKSLDLKHREKMIDYRSNLEKKELELDKILMEDKLDTEKLLSKYEEISKAKEEIAKADIKHKIDIYKLIPEDKKKEAKEILFRPKRFGLRRFLEFPKLQKLPEPRKLLEKMRIFIEKTPEPESN